MTDEEPSFRACQQGSLCCLVTSFLQQSGQSKNCNCIVRTPGEKRYKLWELSQAAILVHHDKNNICMWIKNKWWQGKKYCENIIKNTVTTDRLVGLKKKCSYKKTALKIMKQPRMKLMRLRKWRKKIYSTITHQKNQNMGSRLMSLYKTDTSLARLLASTHWMI